MLCMKPADERCNDARHAELLRWLLDNHPDIDLSAVNARRQTPAHCAIKSGSLEVLEVRNPFPYPDCCAGCLTIHPDIDLFLMNARLQTPAHCAIQLRSLEVLEVRDPFPYPDCCAGCLTNRPDIDLSAMNACLQTSAHCAIQLRLLEVLDFLWWSLTGHNTGSDVLFPCDVSMKSDGLTV